MLFGNTAILPLNLGDSGSQTMAAVMALQNGWGDSTRPVAETLDLKGASRYAVQITPHLIIRQVNNDIHGLVASINDGSTSAFMWEWFTTKPWKDRGEVRFVSILLWIRC